MSLHPHTVYQIPEETRRVAHAAFPQGTLCLHIADALGPIYEDHQFADLFPRRGKPAEAPARLALVTVLQFVEGLSDRQAADSHVLVDSQRNHAVTIIGPVADDPSWQARAGQGFEKSQFLVDWDRHVVTCPAGRQSISWLPNTYPKNGMMWEVRFARKDCTPCVHRAQCTKAKKEPRLLGLQTREQYEALQAARQRQATEAFRQQYAARAGIESTHEQAIRRCGLRRSRYIGLAKTHLQHIITATAINLVRVAAWLEGTPWAKTRQSAFAALAA